METKDILELIEAFEASTLTELRYGAGEEQLVLKRRIYGYADPGGVSSGDRGATGAFVAPKHPTASNDGAPASGAVAAELGAGSQAGADDREQVVSPIVGTFYRSPSPDAPPFVEEGSEVQSGGPLCVLEAMKVMNELQAEFDLEVVTILVENGEMVEYGTPLFEVRRK